MNKTFQRRQFLCEIGDQRKKETRFHNMKEGDSCKLKYLEVKSKEKCCEQRGLRYQAAHSDRGAGACSAFQADACLPAANLELSIAWPPQGV